MSALFGTICSKLCRQLQSIPSNLVKQTLYCTVKQSSSNISTTLFNSVRTATGKSAFPQFVNLPTPSEFAGKGNSFQTQIVRKRVINDPNLPNFEKIGPLKWSTWGMLRDVRRRHIFVRYYPFRACFYNMRKCRSLPNSIREVAFEQERKLPRDSMIQQMRNRCSITGRSRGVLKRYRMSRLCWRHLADNNKLSGVIKASW